MVSHLLGMQFVRYMMITYGPECSDLPLPGRDVVDNKATPGLSGEPIVEKESTLK
jgi:hypothetical protein